MKFLSHCSGKVLNIKTPIWYLVLFGATFSIISGCGGSGGSSDNDSDTTVTIEERLHTALDVANTDTALR